MRILPLSDLHFEFHADDGKEFVEKLDPAGVDVLVLAGDVTKMRLGFDRTLGMFRKRFPDCPILFVPGNHEYHHSNRPDVERALQRVVAQMRGVHWLDCSSVVIDGQRFVGTTLWYGRPTAPKHPLLLSTDEEWARGIIRQVTEKGVTRSLFSVGLDARTIHQAVDAMMLRLQETDPPFRAPAGMWVFDGTHWTLRQRPAAFASGYAAGAAPVFIAQVLGEALGIMLAVGILYALGMRAKLWWQRPSWAPSALPQSVSLSPLLPAVAAGATMAPWRY